jgi:hypothetical protein
MSWDLGWLFCWWLKRGFMRIFSVSITSRLQVADGHHFLARSSRFGGPPARAEENRCEVGEREGACAIARPTPEAEGTVDQSVSVGASRLSLAGSSFNPISRSYTARLVSQSKLAPLDATIGGVTGWVADTHDAAAGLHVAVKDDPGLQVPRVCQAVQG